MLIRSLVATIIEERLCDFGTERQPILTEEVLKPMIEIAIGQRERAINKKSHNIVREHIAMASCETYRYRSPTEVDRGKFINPLQP